jgi:glycosyltransferase involved in cell wall biosynthesis
MKEKNRNNTSKTFKIVFIDKHTLYSYNLYKGFCELIKPPIIIFYGPKHIGPFRYPFRYIKNVWSSYLYPFQIVRHIITDRPDIVHIQYEINTFGPISSTVLLFPILLLLLKIIKTRVIVTLHGILTFDKYTKEKILPSMFKIIPEFAFRIFSRIFYKVIEILSDGIIIHATIFQKMLMEYYGLSKRKLHVIPHGIDIDNSLQHSKKLDNTLSQIYNKSILFFGVITPRKGLEYLIEAFKLISLKYPEYILVIAGYEPSYYKGYKYKLMELTKSLDIESRVIFLGFVKDEEIPLLFSSSEIIVLPYTYGYSASGVLSLAIQYSKQIIATKTSFFNEFLKDKEDALLVSPYNSQELARAIEELLTNNLLREKIIRNITLKAQNYSWKNVAKMTFQTYVNKY